MSIIIARQCFNRDKPASRPSAMYCCRVPPLQSSCSQSCIIWCRRCYCDRTWCQCQFLSRLDLPGVASTVCRRSTCLNNITFQQIALRTPPVFHCGTGPNAELIVLTRQLACAEITTGRHVSRVAVTVTSITASNSRCCTAKRHICLHQMRMLKCK